MNYTDEQLKRALAKMLEQVYFLRGSLFWNNIKTSHPDQVVLDTELLHLCWLAEEGLGFQQQQQVAKEIYNLEADQTDGTPETSSGLYLAVHASWQSRTLALAKTKGIEIV